MLLVFKNLFKSLEQWLFYIFTRFKYVFRVILFFLLGYAKVVLISTEFELIFYYFSSGFIGFCFRFFMKSYRFAIKMDFDYWNRFFSLFYFVNQTHSNRPWISLTMKRTEIIVYRVLPSFTEFFFFRSFFSWPALVLLSEL